MDNQERCLGLTPKSSNEEIKKAAFDFAHSIGYMVFATTAIDGKTPTARGLEIHYLDNDGNLYVGASQGKHFCDEMAENPYVSAMIVNVIAVRINAYLKEVPKTETAIYERYWELNPGTRAMYHKDLSNFRIFKFEKGDGEVFHVYKDDGIARARFSFGDCASRPWSYTIDEDKCIGCGICAKKCMMDTIYMENQKAVTEHYGCNECGICYDCCPNKAIVKNEFTR